MNRRSALVALAALVRLPALAAQRLSSLSGTLELPRDAVVPWPGGRQPARGWPVSTPAEQGVDPLPLAELFDFIVEHRKHVNSLLIVRHGFLIVEAYVAPYSAERTHHLYSATKSIVSLLVGLALDDGFLDHLDQPLLELLPATAADGESLDPRVRAITLRHALTMTTGLEWGESRFPYGDARNPVQRMQRAEDWVAFVLGCRVTSEPGTHFEYNSGVSHVLAAVVQHRVGMPLAAYARRRLFEPLDVTDTRWLTDPKGINIGGWGLYLKPGDMARIGAMLLHGGRWHDRQVVSERWVRESTSARVRVLSSSSARFRVLDSLYRLTRRAARPVALDYGYHWWLPEFGGYAALGSAGQAIFVLPAHDAVVVMTGGLEARDVFLRETLVRDFVLPALHPPRMPQDVAARSARLRASLQRARAGPDGAAAVQTHGSHGGEGRTYRFPSNAAGLSSLRLDAGSAGEATLAVEMGGSEHVLAVGVDGRYRDNRLDAVNTLALQGGWSDDRTFHLQWCWIATGERLEITLAFEGDSLTFLALGAIDGRKRRMIGRAAP